MNSASTLEDLQTADEAEAALRQTLAFEAGKSEARTNHFSSKPRADSGGARKTHHKVMVMVASKAWPFLETEPVTNGFRCSAIGTQKDAQ